MRFVTAAARDDGSVIVETALGVALILSMALPFASLVSYATYAARDLAATQVAVRDAAKARAAAGGGAITFSCGPSPSAADAACVTPMSRGTYVAAAKDTAAAPPLPPAPPPPRGARAGRFERRRPGARRRV